MTRRAEQSGPDAGPDASAPCDASVAPCPLAVVHARLTVFSVTFSAGHDIDNDTFGDFPTPHFQVGRAANPAPAIQRPAQFPYCYARNTKVRLRAVFTVTQKPTGTEPVVIDGEALIGAATLKFNCTVSVSPGDSTVTTPEMESDAALPDMVAKADPFPIGWFQTPVDIPKTGAGTSGNPLYVTLAAPQKTPLHWTLLEVSCTGAAGATDVAAMRTGSFRPLQGRAINRKRDGHDLTYWNPNTTTASNTRLLLSRDDGAGQCGSWAEFLVDMWKAHGDLGGHKIMISQDLDRFMNNQPVAVFLVKNWRFDPPHPPDPKGFHYPYRVKCFETAGVPGQRNANPPPHFANHFIVRADGQYYDPSYGSPTFGTELQWENASIDGLGNGGYGPAPNGSAGGFRKSELLASRWLQFIDLMTGAKL